MQCVEIVLSYRDGRFADVYSRESDKLLQSPVKSNNTEQAGQTIPLFQATTWAAQPTGPNKKQKVHREDLLCYAGGALWSLDWCPAPGTEDCKSCQAQAMLVSTTNLHALLH